MIKILIPLLVLALAFSSIAALPSAAHAQVSPPISPDDFWQPADDGGTSVEPPVGVETYRQTWSNLQIPPPSAVAPGVSSSIVNAYIVNSYGQLLTNLHRNEVCYLVVSFNGPGYFYLWEYYPSGSTPYGHWQCYKWYRPYAGVWRIGPFAAESWDPTGQYVWKMWFLSGFSWTTRTLSFNYTGGYYPPDIPGPTPQPIYPPVINSFSANMSSIDSGQTAILTWTTTNTSAVTISPGVGTVAASGSTTVTPNATTTYTLTATGNSGSPASSSTTITVMPRIPPAISVDQAKIQNGQSAILSWNAPGAVQVYIAGVGDSGVKGTAEVSPDKTTTYTLTATYIDGTAQSASVTVVVEQPPLLLYGLIALLVIAAITVVTLLVRKPAAIRRAHAGATRAANTPPAEATTPAYTSPATTPVEAPPAKLTMPDGSELLLAGNARSFGRHDFEKFLPTDKVSYISRQHINVWYENDRYYIEDRSSTNGTRINGTEIKGTARRALEDGDVIELAGKMNITFRK